MKEKLNHFIDVISDDIINALDGCDLNDYVDKHAITLVIEKGGNISVYENDLHKHIEIMEKHLLMQGDELLVEDWRSGALKKHVESSRKRKKGDA